MGYLSSFRAKKRLKVWNKRVFGKQLTTTEYHKKRIKDYLKASAGFSLSGYPDIVLGFVPLYTVQFYEVAISQDILKYRAVGSQFLAKQKGGNFALRVDAQLNDSYSHVSLTALQRLYRNGQPSEEINDGLKAIKNPKVPSRASTDLFNFGQQSPNEIDNLMMSEDVAVVSPSNKKWLLSTYHKTFTVMTRDTVLFDMFIESIIYWRTLDSDPNTIHISLLLRKFTPPRRIIGNELKKVKTGTTRTLDEKIITDGVTDKGLDIILGWKIGNQLVSHTYNRTVRYIKYEDAYPKNSDKIDLIFNSIHSIGIMRLIYDDWGSSPKRKNIRDHGLLSIVYQTEKFKPVRNKETKLPKPKVTVDNIEYVKITNLVTGQVIKYKSENRILFRENYSIEYDANSNLTGVEVISIGDISVRIKGHNDNNVLEISMDDKKYTTRKDFYIKVNDTFYIFIKIIVDTGDNYYNIYQTDGDGIL